MVIKVLGTGCPSCKTLESHTRKAAEELGGAIEVVKVEDIAKILEYNVIRTPALVIDEQVVLSGRVPSVAQIREIIENSAK